MKYITILFLLFSFSAMAIKQGDTASDFTLKTLSGEKVQLSKLNKNKKVVVVFIRGWVGYQCGLCTRQVNDFVSKKKQFKDQEVVFIYPGPAKALKKHAKEFSGQNLWPKNFHFVLDPKSKVVDAYDLRWKMPNETAYPTTLILGKKRKVIFAKVSKTHGGRAKATTVLKALK